MPLFGKYLPILFVLAFPALAIAAEQTVIIGFHEPVGAVERKLITANGGKVQREFNFIDALLVNIPDTALPGLRIHPGIKYIERDSALHTPAPLPHAVPETSAASVSEYQQNWGIQHIAGELAHSQGVTGAGVKIAVIDTGIDYSHPELRENYRGGYDFVNGDDDPMDDSDFGHGTFVAGIIAAKQNDQGIVGIAPDASLYALKVMDSEGYSSISNLIAALQWTIEHDIDIANISMGGPDSTAFKEACDAAYDAGVLVVAAAGNTLQKTVDHPAAYSSVIAVGAINKQDQAEPYTAKGDEVELAAPGASVYSTKRGDRYGTASGTSQAAPHIAGVAALILSAGVDDLNNDGLTNNRDVRLKLLMATRDLGEPGRDNLYGYGAINVKGIFSNPRQIQLPDLSLTMRDDRDPVLRNSWFNYVLTVQNNGTADAHDAKLLLTLPSDMVVRDDSCTVAGKDSVTGNSKINNTIMECKLGRVAKNGGSRTLNVIVKLVLPGFSNSAAAKARVVSPLEANFADNSAEESTSITNQPPTAGSVRIDAGMNTSRTTYNVLNSARDPDRDALFIDSADSVSQAGGMVVNHDNGTFTYTPPQNFTGSDSFDYVISDGRGGTVTGTVDIAVRIGLAINIEDSADPVVAGDSVVYTITIANNSFTDVHALELIIDFQNGAMGFLAVDKSCKKNQQEALLCSIEKIDKNGGAVTLQLTARALTEKRERLNAMLFDKNGIINPGFSGEETIIKNPNGDPVAHADYTITDENTPLTIGNILDNDTDTDGDRLHITGVDETSRQGGNVVLDNESSVSYTPPADFSGEDSFQYTISDGNGGTATGTVTVMVNKKVDPEPVSLSEPDPFPPTVPEPSQPRAGALGVLVFLILFTHLSGLVCMNIRRFRVKKQTSRTTTSQGI